MTVIKAASLKSRTISKYDYIPYEASTVEQIQITDSLEKDVINATPAISFEKAIKTELHASVTNWYSGGISQTTNFNLVPGKNDLSAEPFVVLWQTDHFQRELNGHWPKNLFILEKLDYSKKYFRLDVLINHFNLWTVQVFF